MPPDVFLVLASGGISFVASLMFLVNGEAAPKEKKGPLVSFCLPPHRPSQLQRQAPELPQHSVDLSTEAMHQVMTVVLVGGEWVVSLETTPREDMPALDLGTKEGLGLVHDLRWKPRAGLAKKTRRSWKQKPGQA